MEFASRVRVLLLMSLFALVVEFVPVASVHAQSPRVVRVVCPEAALNVPLYERALAQRIRTLIDRNLYKQERVRVTLRRVGGETGVRTSAVDDVLSGVTLTTNGLTVLATGQLSFDLRCEHTYVARIRVTATEVTTGVRFSSSTDSLLRINSSGEASVVGRAQ